MSMKSRHFLIIDDTMAYLNYQNVYKSMKSLGRKKIVILQNLVA